MASEGELGRKWDRCLADAAVKLGKGREGRAQEGDPGRSGHGRSGVPKLGASLPAQPRGAAEPGEEGPVRPGVPSPLCA